MMSKASPESTEVDKPGFVNDPKRLGRAVFGAALLAVFIGYFMVASGMDAGTLRRPGAGMYPFWLGLGGIIISLIVIIESIFTSADSGKIDYPKGRDKRNTIVFVVMLLAFILFLPYGGMYISASLFAVAFLKIVGGVSWTRTLIIGIAMGVGVTFCFDALFNLPLPSGSLLP